MLLQILLVCSKWFLGTERPQHVKIDDVLKVLETELLKAGGGGGGGGGSRGSSIEIEMHLELGIIHKKCNI